jgi:hypothetical protein
MNSYDKVLKVVPYVIKFWGLCFHKFKIFWKHAATRPNSLTTKYVYINWHQYCNFSEAQIASSLMMVYLKPKHVGAFVLYFNVNFNILKQIGCALVRLIKD